MPEFIAKICAAGEAILKEKSLRIKFEEGKCDGCNDPCVRLLSPAKLVIIASEVTSQAIPERLQTKGQVGGKAS